jgi:hypothetical protein
MTISFEILRRDNPLPDLNFTELPKLYLEFASDLSTLASHLKQSLDQSPPEMPLELREKFLALFGLLVCRLDILSNILGISLAESVSYYLAHPES